jgi:hypothetical protein
MFQARIVRAIVTTDARAAIVQREAASAFASTIVEVGRPGDGLARAAAWLRHAPPARREVVVAAPLTRGSLLPEELRVVPRDVGIRFDRVGATASTADVDGGRTLGPLTSGDRARVVDRIVALDGERSRVRERRSGEIALPVRVRAPDRVRSVLQAAQAAVLSEHATASPPDRRATLVVPGEGVGVPVAAPIRTPWIADAVAAIASDADLRSTARRLGAPAGGAAIAGSSWQPVVRAVNGQPLVSAGEGEGGLLVVSRLAPDDVATPVLIRAIFESLSPERRAASRPEVLRMVGDELRVWQRDPAAPSADDIRRRSSDGDDDRRPVWAAVLALFAVESWMRRRRARTAVDRPAERSRVA